MIRRLLLSTVLALGALGVVAHELGTGTLRLALGIAGNTQACGVLGDLGTHFTLETGPAMHKQGIHLLLQNGWHLRQP